MSRSVTLTQSAQKQVMKELRQLIDKPCPDITVTEDSVGNLSQIVAELNGPEGTPYEGGVFKVRLILPHNFPETPPRGYFATRIFHPNISSTGEICVNVLSKDWKANLGLRHILLVIRCLLIEPFPQSALNEEAGRLFMDDFQEYFRQASLWTQLYGSNSLAIARMSRPLAAIESNNSQTLENDEHVAYNSSSKQLSPKSGKKLTGNWIKESKNSAKYGIEQTRTSSKRSALRRL
eukprot:TRINITY_DN2312_c0_g1_i5.p1 TRINITY_DN2312_c0_g1~~TRINITY_DN2312_c0_g1_i5.p1  ORF type:complete len:235 (+),score=17.28 TRINITY_DN2312_c0_g1_i5:242-946(+)